MALLTGRLVLLPERLLPALRSALAVSPAEIPAAELPGFVRVAATGGALTGAVTALLLAGELHVLVGTRALLGEGWDAPAVNSLVLATSIGSFMMTNQMRGRAIRVDPAHPAKAASVWHLAAVDPGPSAGLADLTDLIRRFRTFVGVANGSAIIESGLERLSLPYFAQGQLLPLYLHPPRNNQEMAGRLHDFSTLPARWREATERGAARVAPSVRTVKPPSLRRFHLDRTLSRLLLAGGSLFVEGSLQSLQGMRAVRPQSGSELLMFISVAALGGGILAFPPFIKAMTAWLRHLPVDGSLHQIAFALVDALAEAGLIAPGSGGLQVTTRREGDGRFTVALEGGEFYERAPSPTAWRRSSGRSRTPATS